MNEQNEETDLAVFEQLLRNLLGLDSDHVGRRLPRLRRPHQYILDARDRPIPVANTLKWVYWMGANVERCIVGQTTLPNGLWVSTVFLGLNHNFTGGSRLHLFETMIKMHGRFTNHQWRYSTHERAEYGHRALVRLFSAKTHKEGEDAAALSFPEHVVNLAALRSDYATGFSNLPRHITRTRPSPETESDDRTREIRQAYSSIYETIADRSN